MPYARTGALLLLSVLSSSALAQAPAAPSVPVSPALKEARAKMRAACAGDVGKLCANVERGGALGRCLRDHQAELSAECGAARESLRALRAKAKAQ
jgi:hypothetical protein